MKLAPGALAAIQHRFHRHIRQVAKPAFDAWPNKPIPLPPLAPLLEATHRLVWGQARNGRWHYSERASRLHTDEMAAPRRTHRAWFPVPGMYGGFSYWIEETENGPRLVAEHWVRIVEGSWERHIITPSTVRKSAIEVARLVPGKDPGTATIMTTRHTDTNTAV